MKEKCRLKIKTRTGPAGDSLTETEGSHYERDGRHHVLFNVDGDRCRLEFDEEQLTYHRQGALSYSLKLKAGEKSDTGMVTPYGSARLEYLVQGYTMEHAGSRISINTSYSISEEICDMKIEIIKENKT